jgi:hypothetical protein
MFNYRGRADCALSDGTSVPVSVVLATELGLIDSIVGTATSANFPVPYLNATEVTLRLPDGRARKFLIKNKLSMKTMELASNGDWLQ